MSLRKHFQLIVLIIFASGLVGCNGAWLPLGSEGSSTGVWAAESAAEPTATPTPFTPQEMVITEVPPGAMTDIPTAVVTEVVEFNSLEPWGNFASPSEPSPVEIPPPMPEIAFSAKTVNIVLLGSDQRPGSYGYRTDSIMVVSIDPENGRVIMLSLPRDLYVYIPGWRMERINAADAHGGFETLQQTLLYNLGIPVEYYVCINFGGFIAGIDTLGGIDVDVNGYLNDEYGGVYYEYFTGTYHMDGHQTLGYVRMRKTSSDFDRLRRQQEVVKAIVERVFSLDGITRLPELYEQFSYLFQTNMKITDLLGLVPIASDVAADKIDIESLAIDQSMVTSWRVPYSGAAVLQPQWDVILEKLSALFSQ